MASLFACLIFISSIIKLSTTQTQKNMFGEFFNPVVEKLISSLKISFLFLCDNFLESFILEIKSLSGIFFLLKQNAHATTGQSHGHLPASSTQIIIFDINFIKKIFYI